MVPSYNGLDWPSIAWSVKIQTSFKVTTYAKITHNNNVIYMKVNSQLVFLCLVEVSNPLTLSMKVYLNL